jgi:hypothetical protein
VQVPAVMPFRPSGMQDRISGKFDDTRDVYNNLRIATGERSVFPRIIDRSKCR